MCISFELHILRTKIKSKYGTCDNFNGENDFLCLVVVGFFFPSFFLAFVDGSVFY